MHMETHTSPRDLCFAVPWGSVHRSLVHGQKLSLPREVLLKGSGGNSASVQAFLWWQACRPPEGRPGTPLSRQCHPQKSLLPDEELNKLGLEPATSETAGLLDC